MGKKKKKKKLAETLLRKVRTQSVEIDLPKKVLSSCFPRDESGG